MNTFMLTTSHWVGHSYYSIISNEHLQPHLGSTNVPGFRAESPTLSSWNWKSESHLCISFAPLHFFYVFLPKPLHFYCLYSSLPFWSLVIWPCWHESRPDPPAALSPAAPSLGCLQHPSTRSPLKWSEWIFPGSCAEQHNPVAILGHLMTLSSVGSDRGWWV